MVQMKAKILKRIKKIEKEENVKVLFLIESGSRGWGWESKDSDYDVRGVFIQDYLQVSDDDIKKQINQKDKNIDIELWDLRKFFSLMYDSNPSVWEWLSSDIIYLDNPIRIKLKEIFKKEFNENSLMRHYVSMARQNFHKYINQIGDKANLKKYVYVLRSIACVLWIEDTHSPPPKNYKEIIKLLPLEVYSFFRKVVKDKRKSESLEGKRNEKVEKYIMSFFYKEFYNNESRFDMKALNNLFKSIIKKCVHFI